jgi:glycolate oxidase
VQAVLKACHALDVPVVARGAGTGLSGGAMPHALGVTLSLAKFNRILKLDPPAARPSCSAACATSRSAKPPRRYGLYYAPDPSSQIACTIGGNVAENSGGVHCLKYGLTVHNVLKVRGFTADGEEVEFGGDALDTPGYDLLSVIIGSEGMLAVTTEVTVKLVPKPQLARCIMASFDDLRKAGDAVAAVIAAGIIPAGLEMMDKPMTAAVEDFVHAGYDLTPKPSCCARATARPEEVEEEIGRMSEVLRAAARPPSR